MAIKLTGNYAKRLGLPGYSSHQFSVSVETELTDLSQVEGEASRIYRLLQDAVDREIQDTGFVPGDEYGLRNLSPVTTTNGHRKGATHSNGHEVRWACSDKQKELILRLVTENDLDRDSVEETSLDRFGAGVRQLNKLQASGLIAELIELTGKDNGRQNNGHGRKGAKR
ncbi:MAG: hypothetical protein KDN18_10960 [Verrucomicrobiae bacterium]|nr:hypothetical protein [Verrucomicrobiae bacterium]